MTFGQKLLKYRLMRNMTQKDLGLAVGFSAATADSRIRKYEKDIMAPKKDIREKIAQALDIHISALSDVDIASPEDMIQSLFQFEDEYSMKIDKIDGKIALTFDESKANCDQLLGFLYAWHSQKNLYALNADDENEQKKYQIWKARFPYDISEYWEQLNQNLSKFYAPMVKALAGKRNKITKLADIIMQLRKVIESDISIEHSTQGHGVGCISLNLYFYLSELMNKENTAGVNAFAELLYDFDTLKEYGVVIDQQIITKEKGTQIAYYLHLSPLAPITSTLDKITENQSNKATKNDWDIKSFEDDYADDLSLYNVDIKDYL